MAPEPGTPAADLSTNELFQIASSFSSTLDLDALLLKIGLASERLLDSEASSIMLVDDLKQNLFFKTATGSKVGALKKILVPIGKGIAGTVAQSKTPLIVNDASKDPRFTGQVDKSSGFQTRSLICVPMFYRGELVGVAEVLNKRGDRPYTEKDLGLLNSLANLASVAITNAKLVADQKNFFSHVLELLVMGIESTKNRYHGHPNRAARLACAIGRLFEVERAEYNAIYYAGLLHDIGYVGLRNPALMRSMGLAELNPSEDLHPVVGIKMLEGIHMIAGAMPIIQHHHERFDGQGFPDKLAKDAIPLGARILALVEAVEELRIIGVKNDELVQKAVLEAKNGSGTRFDPDIVAAFLQLMEEQPEVWR
ncbi:MAG: hypothetical protein A3G41_08150 [Elusimicrobia bacterium RIFCSPLOWO2_12_FULL_59_9]|nr:MAG: hypothetical protein A3G41_08150 [Elusimicrobia bacterium RIFCSPLOWO2_12_FULL_59_9]